MFSPFRELTRKKNGNVKNPKKGVNFSTVGPFSSNLNDSIFTMIDRNNNTIDTE